MIIQDIAIAFASCLFIISLLFQLYHGFKSKDLNSISYPFILLTLIALCIIFVSFYSVKYYFSGITTNIQFVLWSMMLWMKIRYSKI